MTQIGIPNIKNNLNIVILDAATLKGADLSGLTQENDKLNLYSTTQKHEIIDRCSDADVIITNKVVLDKFILTKLTKLKLICIAATGTNNIDLNAAKELKIKVTNVTGYSTHSVVQHTFALLTNLMGNCFRYIQDSKNAVWQQSKIFCNLDHSITEIHGKTLTIIGYGELGQAVARLAEAFGMKVLLAERKNALNIRSGRTNFHTAIEQADIISLHCPLTDETKNLISDAEFGIMKPSAVVINTARGGIIDEHALINALKNNAIFAAATDVLTTEPALDNNPLIQYQGDNLIITPHIAWATQESIQRLVDQIAINIQTYRHNQVM